MSHQKIQSCIDACLACVIECNRCSTACLNEADIEAHIRCIQIERQCVIICLATAQLMSIGGQHATHLCAECSEICDECATECGKHAHLEHCLKCSEVCRKCAIECEGMSEMAA